MFAGFFGVMGDDLAAMGLDKDPLLGTVEGGDGFGEALSIFAPEGPAA